MKTDGNDPITAIKDVGFNVDTESIAFDPSKADFKVSFAGLTKREHFAALAMQGMLPATFSPNGLQGGTADALADYAVKVADALIEALNKEGNQ